MNAPTAATDPPFLHLCQQNTSRPTTTTFEDLAAAPLPRKHHLHSSSGRATTTHHRGRASAGSRGATVIAISISIASVETLILERENALHVSGCYWTVKLVNWSTGQSQ